MRTCAVLAGVLCMLTAPARSQDTAMTLLKIEYQISELPEYPNQLTLTPTEVRYESHSNASRPDAGIGVFERRPEPGEVDALESQVVTSAFRAVPDHYGKVRSGDRVKRIRLTIGTDTVEKMVGTALPVAPELQRVIDALDAVIDRVIQSPKHVLQMQLASGALQGHEFSATLTVRSAGETPASVALPGPQAEAGAWTIYWWPDVQGQPKSDVHVAAVTSSAPASSGAPSAYRITSRFDDLPAAGTIAVQVRYLRMAPGANASDDLVGQLFSNVTVVR